MSVHKLKLKANHTWRSKPGYSICVLDRGAVRFDYPSSWKVDMAEGAVYLHDREPSIESCDLGVSIFRVPMESIAELPIEEMLTHSLGSDRNPYEQSEIRRGNAATWTWCGWSRNTSKRLRTATLASGRPSRTGR